MKGIILAGRTQRSHWPWVGAASQQLVSVHDKPMIYYPLSTLITAGARDIMVITDSQDASAVHRILGDGSQFGVSLSYGVQPEPHGVAQALTIGAEFIGSQRVALRRRSCRMARCRAAEALRSAGACRPPLSR